MDIRKKMQALDEQCLVSSGFPFPIAASFERILGTDVLRNQAAYLYWTYNTSLRYLSILALSHYIEHTSQDDELRITKLDQWLRSSLRRATDGRWRDPLGIALDHYSKEPDRFVCPPLLSWYRSKWRVTSDKIISFRNKFLAHGTPYETGDFVQATEALVPQMENWLRSIDFVRDLTLVLTSGETGEKSIICMGSNLEDFRVEDSSEVFPEPGILPNHYFIRMNPEKFVSLHPLLVYWEEETDLCIYSDFLSKKATFLPVASSKANYAEFSDKKLLDAITGIVTEAKRRLYRTDLEFDKEGKPTFKCVQGVLEKYSENQLRLFEGKYDREYYLTRKRMEAEIESYLAGDCSTLVIVGNSGIGKSSLLCHTLEEFSLYENYCVLLLNGHGVNIGSASDFLEIVARIVSKEMELSEFWPKTLLRILRESEGRLVVLLDAINEHSDPKRLFQLFNEMLLVHSAEDLAPVKFILTSRPGVWSELKGMIRLPEVYYASDGDENHISLTDFNSADELPEVYELYRARFRFQTPFGEVTPEVKATLRDPLMLRLVAETCENEPVPQSLDPNRIYSHYFRKKGLREAESFLQDYILPVMDSSRSNSITEEEIRQLRIREGSDTGAKLEARAEMIFDHLSRLANQIEEGDESSPYMQLTRSGIITEEEDLETGTYHIRFRYERFYDYFMGEYCLARLKGRPRGERARGIIELCASFEEGRNFLWGVIVHVLSSELSAGDHPSLTVMDLLENAGLARKRLVLEALKRVFETDSAAVVRMTEDLYAAALEEQTVASRGTDVCSRAREVAIDMGFVAGTSGKGNALSGFAARFFLFRGIYDPDPVLRRNSGRYFYTLWIAHFEEGKEALTEAFGSFRKFVRVLLSKRRGMALDFINGITLTILGTKVINVRDWARDRYVVLLRDLFLGLLAPLVFRGDGLRGVIGLWKIPLRWLILRVGAKVTLGKWRGAIPELLGRKGEALIPPLPEEREEIEAMLPYADPDSAGEISARAKEMMFRSMSNLYSLSNPLTRFVPAVMLKKDFDGTVELLREYFDKDRGAALRNSILAILEFICIWNDGRAVKPIDELSRRFLEENAEDVKGCDHERMFSYHPLEHGPRSWCEEKGKRKERIGCVIPLAEDLLRSVAEKNDPALMKGLLANLTALAVTSPHSTLATVEKCLGLLELDDPTIHDALACCVGTARVVEPVQATEFLQRCSLGPRFEEATFRAIDPKDVYKCVDAFGGANLYKALYLASPAVRGIILELFGSIATARSEKVWILSTIRMLLAFLEKGWKESRAERGRGLTKP